MQLYSQQQLQSMGATNPNFGPYQQNNPYMNPQSMYNQFGYTQNFGYPQNPMMNNQMMYQQDMSQLQYRCRWIMENLYGQLQNLLNEQKINKEGANYILQLVEKNIQQFEQNLCAASNNYTNQDTSFYVSWFGNVIQYGIDMYNQYNNQRMVIQQTHNDMVFNQMASASNMPMQNYNSYPAYNHANMSTPVSNNPLGIPDYIWNDPSNVYWSSVPMHLRPEHVRQAHANKNKMQNDHIQQPTQVTQQYNNNNNAVISSNTGHISNNNYNNPDVQTNMSEQQAMAQTIKHQMENDEPIVAGGLIENKAAEKIISADDMIVLPKYDDNEFNPDDKYTWPMHLVDKYFELEKSDKNDMYKKFFSAMAVGSEYWKSKGIHWTVDDSGIKVNEFVKAVDKKKDESPYSLKATATINHSNLDIVTKDGKLFNDLNATEIKQIDFTNGNVQNGTKRVIFAEYDDDHVYLDEIDCIKDVCDGSLKDAELVKRKTDDGEITPTGINIHDTFDGLVVGLNYNIAKQFDISSEIMEKYMSEIRSILATYEGGEDILSFKSMYKKFVDYTKDKMIRRHSEDIEKYLIDRFNEVLFRNIKTLTKGAYVPPVISKYENILDLIKEDDYAAEYNLLIDYDNFKIVLCAHVFEELLNIFAGHVLNTEEVETLYGDHDHIDFDKTVIVAVKKRVVFTDVMPNTGSKYIRKGRPCMSSGIKPCNDLFHCLIVYQINEFTSSTNIVIMNDHEHKNAYKPKYYLAIHRSLDHYIGYAAL